MKKTLIIILVLAALGAGYYYYEQHKKKKNLEEQKLIATFLPSNIIDLLYPTERAAILEFLTLRNAGQSPKAGSKLENMMKAINNKYNLNSLPTIANTISKFNPFLGF